MAVGTSKATPAGHCLLQGIVFSVRPPRKSWKNIANLSGGEKTLSSLSLVFALHHYKPTPLYVMDEIDAALGEAVASTSPFCWLPPPSTFHEDMSRADAFMRNNSCLCTLGRLFTHSKTLQDRWELQQSCCTCS